MSLPRRKIWAITGVSSGFGRALAAAALDRGDHVHGTLRREEDVRAFEALAPGRAVAHQLDVTDEAAVYRVTDAIETQSGGVDVLVNNAGYGLVAGVEETSLAETRAQFEVNVFGALAVMQAALPYMRARRAGHIINITSVSGLVGWPSLGVYSGSKFALEGISETLAQEVAPLGIKLTMVEPGGFRTDFARRSRIRGQREIADYDATVGACKRILDEHAGHERGDPRRAAESILHIVDAAIPPLRLLLGADAVEYANNKLSQQIDEIEQWKSLSLATDFAPASGWRRSQPVKA
jgi:NAD(P)-dependent dehydrogenase (short-subunit alcohol dehydrogenase family)